MRPWTRCWLQAGVLLAAGVLAACSSPPTEIVLSRGPSAHEQGYACPDWMDQSQCGDYETAMNHLATVCPEVVFYVTSGSYAINYDAFDTVDYGCSYPSNHYAMWLTYYAFDSAGELENTIAHEYGHNTGIDEDAATTYGNSCGSL